MSRRSAFPKLLILVPLALLWFNPAAAFEGEVERLAGQLVPSIEQAAIGKIAVVDFADLEGQVTHLGRFLAEELSNGLMRQKSGLVVIDRNHLGRILEEQKLSVNGLVNPAEARQIGRIAGVQAFVFGTLTPLGDQVRLTVKVIDADRAHLVATSEAKIARVGTIDELLKQGVSPVQGGASTSKASHGATSGPASQAQVHIQEQRKFVFELQRCELSGQTVDCFVHVRNDAKERVLVLGGRSRMFDDNGNNYRPSRTELANNMQAIEDTKYSDRYGVQNTLLYAVPVRAAVSFEGVSPQATRVAALKLYFRVADDNDWFEVSFTDVPLSARQVESIQMTSSAGLVSPAPGMAPIPAGPGGAIPVGGPTQTPTLEETIDAEITDLASEAVRRAGQSLLNLFKKGKKKKKAQAAEDEESPDGR